MRSIAETWLASKTSAVIVQVQAHRGSVPRESGATLLVSETQVHGTIGGGHLEWKAIQEARACLQNLTSLPVTQTWALGPSLGQCCGGAVTLTWTRLEAGALPALPGPRFFLQLHGSGHVGRAVARLLAHLPCQVQWIDARYSEFPLQTSPDHIVRICSLEPEAEILVAPPGACFLVMTHSHDLDYRLTKTILKRNDFAWFGLIGSDTKRARFRNRLSAQGFQEDHLNRMVCPIGIPGLTGKEPEIIAMSVVSQLLMASQTG